MANDDKDRVPDETLAPSLLPGMRGAGLPPGVLLVRPWAAAGKRLDCRVSKSSTPLLGVVLDVLTSSGGVPGAENAEYLAASFPDLVTGLQCARRIQWALEGLTESEAFRGAAAAMLMAACDESGRYAAPSDQDWIGVDPGKVVLKPEVFEALDGVPGIALGGATAAGLREWVWKSAAGHADFAADEQVVQEMLRAAGQSDPAPVADGAGDAPTRMFTHAAAVAARTDDAQPAAAGLPFLKSKAMVAGAAAALLIVVAVVFFLTRKAPVQSAAPTQTPAVAPAAGSMPSTAAPAATGPATEAHANPATSPQKHTKLGDLFKKGPTPDKTTPAPVVSRCDLSEEEIQRSLTRADRYMHDGDLADARAAYQHVLGCSSAHERAQAGLVRIQRMAAQSGSPN